MTFPYSEQNATSRHRLETLVQQTFRGGLRPLHGLWLDGRSASRPSRVLGPAYARDPATMEGGGLRPFPYRCGGSQRLPQSNLSRPGPAHCHRALPVLCRSCGCRTRNSHTRNGETNGGTRRGHRNPVPHEPRLAPRWASQRYRGTAQQISCHVVSSGCSRKT